MLCDSNTVLKIKIDARGKASAARIFFKLTHFYALISEIYEWPCLLCPLQCSVTQILHSIIARCIQNDYQLNKAIFLLAYFTHRLLYKSDDLFLMLQILLIVVGGLSCIAAAAFCIHRRRKKTSSSHELKVKKNDQVHLVVSASID